jgi:hypothetical protein
MKLTFEQILTTNPTLIPIFSVIKHHLIDMIGK